MADTPTMTVREACKKRVPLDGADAQALEKALQQTESELAAACAERDAYKHYYDEEWERCEKAELKNTELEERLQGFTVMMKQRDKLQQQLSTLSGEIVNLHKKVGDLMQERDYYKQRLEPAMAALVKIAHRDFHCDCRHDESCRCEQKIVQVVVAEIKEDSK